MKLLLVRHGAAAMAAPDASRPLTERGQRQSEELFSRHADAWQGIDAVLCSPYLRAQQSADLLAQIEPFLPAKEISAELIPDSSIDAVYRLLEQYTGGRQSVILIGHNPLFSDLLNRLLGKPRGFCYLGTSGIAQLEVSLPADACAQLEWLEEGY